MNEINLIPIMKKNKSILETLHRTTSMGVALLNREGRFLYANDFFTSELGYSPETLLSMDYTVISSPVFRKRTKRLVKGLLENKYPHIHMRKRIYRQDGSTVPVHVYGYTFHSEIDDRDKILSFYLRDDSFMHYITQKKGICRRDDYENGRIDWGNLAFLPDNGKIIYAQGPFTEVINASERTLETESHIDQLFTKESLIAIEDLLKKGHGPYIRMETTLNYSPESQETFDTDMIWNNTCEWTEKEVILMFFSRKERKESPNLKMQEEIDAIKKMISTLSQSLSAKEKENYGKAKPLSLSPYNLTSREKQILTASAEMKSAKEIAYDLRIAEITVRKHLTNIYRKFQVRGKEELLLKIHNRPLVN